MRSGWDRAAPGWNAHHETIGAWLRDATEAMIAMAGVQAGMRVLDVAAGTGEPALTLAARVGPTGHVLAIDLSPACVALARANLAAAGCANVECRVADGESLEVEPSSFDAAVCRLGLMFFRDPVQGLRRIHCALRPGGRVCTVVFGRPETNPCLTILMSTALKHAGQPPRDPFAPGSLMSLGRPGDIDRSMRDAGFGNVATTSIDAPFRLRSASDYLAFVRSSASPIFEVLAHVDDRTAQAAYAEMKQRLAVFQTTDGWQGPNELLLTAGRRPLETA